jgi:hypothetical protein
MINVTISTKEYQDFLDLQHAMAIEFRDGTVKFENEFTQKRIAGYVEKLMNTPRSINYSEL